MIDTIKTFLALIYRLIRYIKLYHFIIATIIISIIAIYQNKQTINSHLFTETIIINQNNNITQEIKSTADKELLELLMKILGGFVIFWGLYINNRRQKTIEEDLKLTRENLKLIEDGNITERFKNAIEHLGNDNLSVRLGGIHALHRIAKESEKDRESILNILLSFIKENSKPTNLEKPNSDIQAIIEVLFSKKNESVYLLAKQSGNLQEANLSYLLMKRTSFKTADLTFSDFNNSDLTDCDLTYTNLSSADLSYSILMSADLSNANLSGSDLSRADITLAKFINANLSFAKFIETDISFTNLTNADLTCADLSNIKTSNYGLIIEQLLNVKSLYEVKNLDSKIKSELLKRKPELFKKPDNLIEL